MIRKSKHYFNTSGPNKPEKHYTLKREYLIKKGKKQVAYYAKSISVDVHFSIIIKDIGYFYIHNSVRERLGTGDGFLILWVHKGEKKGVHIFFNVFYFVHSFANDAMKVRKPLFILVLYVHQGINAVVCLCIP